MSPAMILCFAMAESERVAGHPCAKHIVAGARCCVGARFRPQGRGPGDYDCLGVLLAAAKQAGIKLIVRSDYALGSCSEGEVLATLIALRFRRIDCSAGFSGDIAFAAPAAGHVHFAILTDQGLVEAHAGLRRVVERPLKAEERWQSIWRLPEGID